MDYIFIDKTLKTSIYKQIVVSITNAIEEGRLRYNDRLPTEKEICEIFDISITAVRMAYNKLIEEDKIKRIKGKGTFVTNRGVHHVKFHEIYAYEDQLKNNPDYQVRSLVFDSMDDDIVLKRMLKLTEKTKIYFLSRVVSYKNNPIIYQKIYLPEKCFPDAQLFAKPFELLFELVSQCKSGVKHFHNTFSPIKASSAEAQVLNILPNEAIYWVRSLIIDSNSKSIGFITNFFPGEFTEFEVTVHAKQ